MAVWIAAAILALVGFACALAYVWGYVEGRRHGSHR
jgi:hypothetical protein